MKIRMNISTLDMMNLIHAFYSVVPKDSLGKTLHPLGLNWETKEMKLESFVKPILEVISKIAKVDVVEEKEGECAEKMSDFVKFLNTKDGLTLGEKIDHLRRTK